MKKLLVILATLALIAGMGVMKAEAAPTANITVTVTLVEVSVTLDTTTWNLSTTPIVPGSQVTISNVTATNNGTVTEDLTINCGVGTGGTIDWAVSADITPGVNEFAMEVQSIDTPGPGNLALLGGTSVLFGNNIAAAGSRDFDLRFTAPATGSDYVQHTILVTVTAASAT